MKVLLLGGAGFIGSHLVDGLLRATEYELIVYDLYSEKIDHNLENPRLRYICSDLRNDHKHVEHLVKDSDLVIDLIAHANPALYVTIPLEVFQLNFIENLKIAEYCSKHNKRLIQFSSCEVYGKTVAAVLQDKLPHSDNIQYALFNEDTTPMILGPVNKRRWIYSCAKQLLERVLDAFGMENRLNYTIIRPFNFIGPRIDYLPSEQDGSPRVFSHFLQSLMDGSPMQLVDGGHQKRSYTYIDDSISCILKIIKNPNGACNKEIFNIGSPDNEISIRELALKMLEIFKLRWWDGKSSLPKLVEVSGTEFYGEGYDDSDRRIPDITKARSLLGWKPQYDIIATIELSMKYWFEDQKVTHSEKELTNQVKIA